MRHAVLIVPKTASQAKRKRQGSPATTATTKRHTIALDSGLFGQPRSLLDKAWFATEITKTGDADGQHRRNTSSIQSGSNANTFPFMDPCRRAEKRRPPTPTSRLSSLPVIES